MSRRQEILDSADRVVAVPACTSKALSMLEDPDVDFHKLARIIEHDPGLTANLLKVVNSSAVARKRPMLTAAAALKWLEAPDILKFIISIGVAPSYIKPIDGYDQVPSMHLQQSVTVALCTRELGRVLGMDMPEHAYTAALLSGVGKLVLGTYMEVDMPELMGMVLDRGIPMDRAEDELLGINHAELGGILLSRWGLPPQITDVVCHHLRPEESEVVDPVLDLVHVGNVLAKMIGVGLGVDGLNYEVSSTVVNRLGITSSILDQVSANVVLELEGLWDLFIECAEDSCII